MDYVMGNHPFWQLFRAAYQITKKPYIFRGLALETGYLWSFLRRVERPVTHEFVKFHRREQMARLKSKLSLRSLAGNSAAPVHSEVRENS